MECEELNSLQKEVLSLRAEIGELKKQKKNHKSAFSAALVSGAPIVLGLLCKGGEFDRPLFDAGDSAWQKVQTMLMGTAGIAFISFFAMLIPYVIYQTQINEYFENTKRKIAFYVISVACGVLALLWGLGF